MKRIGFAVLVAAALAACQTDRPLHAPLTADIQDANSGGSNAFFFWLPPIRQQQPDADQVFSKLVRPEVRITDEGPANPTTTQTPCSQGTLIRSFSGSAIGISAAEYRVNWHTNEDVLHAECKYRITVVAGGDVLGFAEIDVVNSGKALKDVDTGEFIALLDGRTLPIKFFVGTGSLCGDVEDCGEGIARGGENTTIVTTSGRAGVFIPADALDPGVEVRITVESVDGARGEFECIPHLFQQYPGTADVTNNACYDYHAEQISPPTEQSGRFTFNTNVTVGICPDVVANDLDHATQDLLQLFQFDVGASPVALNNVPAPFLRCDPGFNPNFGARRSGVMDLAARRLRSLVQPVAALFTPRPLYAGSNRLLLDIGTGGETDGFSRFTWAFPFDVSIDFDEAPDVVSVAPGTVVNTLYSRLGVTFSRTNPQGLCPGSSVYANSSASEGEQNDVTVCPEGSESGFSEDAFGAIQATFTVPVVQVCIDATPLQSSGEEGTAEAFIEAFSETGEPLDRDETVEGGSEQLCVSADEISYVRFAGKDAGLAIFDNFYAARALTEPEIE